MSATVPPLWELMTPKQRADVKSGRIKLSINPQNGMVIAKGGSAVRAGKSPRQAIELLPGA